MKGTTVSFKILNYTELEKNKENLIESSIRRVSLERKLSLPNLNNWRGLTITVKSQT